MKAVANTPAVLDEIQLEFELFDRKNPHIYREIVRLAREAKAVGLKKYGIQSIFERLRWHYVVETKHSDFRLNNDFCSRYARKIMACEPDLNGFFSIRPLKAEQKAIKLAQAKEKFDKAVEAFLKAAV